MCAEGRCYGGVGNLNNGVIGKISKGPFKRYVTIPKGGGVSKVRYPHPYCIKNGQKRDIRRRVVKVSKRLNKPLIILY